MIWKQMTLDRVATPELMDLLQPGGIAHSLVERRNKNLSERDPSERLIDPAAVPVEQWRELADLNVAIINPNDVHPSNPKHPHEIDATRGGDHR